MQKKPFLLIEVLIAFILVTLCLLPLVKQPLKLYREEMANLEKIEIERLADWAFTEVREKLLKNEIAWEKIPSKGETSAIFLLQPVTIEIPGCKPKIIKREFYFTGRAEKTGLNEETFRQLGVYILLNKEKYGFRIPVQKQVLKREKKETSPSH